MRTHTPRADFPIFLNLGACFRLESCLGYIVIWLLKKRICFLETVNNSGSVAKVRFGYCEMTRERGYLKQFTRNGKQFLREDALGILSASLWTTYPVLRKNRG